MARARMGDLPSGIGGLATPCTASYLGASRTLPSFQVAAPAPVAVRRTNKAFLRGFMAGPFPWIFFVGYPKTGSTYIQQTLASNDDLNLLKSRGAISSRQIGSFHRRIADKLQRLTENSRPGPSAKDTFDRYITLTDDRAFDPMFARGILAASKAEMPNVMELGVVRPGLTNRSSKRLAAAFPEAHVVVVLRNQIDLIRSRLNHDFQTFYRRDRKAFSRVRCIEDVLRDEECTYPFCISEGNCSGQCGSRKMKSYDTRYFLFDEAVSILEGDFPTRAHVLIYEAGLDAGLSRLFEKIGLKHRPQPRARANISENGIGREDVLPLLTSDFRSAVMKSNRRLSELLGYSLEPYRFPMTSADWH